MDKKEETRLMSIRIPVKLHDDFKAILSQEGKTVSAVIRLMIQEYVDEVNRGIDETLEGINKDLKIQNDDEEGGKNA